MAQILTHQKDQMMNARKNLKLVTLTSLLLVASACGNDKKKSSSSPVNQRPEVNAVCKGIQCMDSINWKILLQGQVFPEKTRVEINGNTVLDECLGKQQYRIDRNSAPESITLENFFVPKDETVKIHLVDQGWDCSQQTTFLHNESVKYEVVNGAVGSEILINL